MTTEVKAMVDALPTFTRMSEFREYVPRDKVLELVEKLTKPSEPAIMEIMTDHDEIKAEMDRVLGFSEPETKVGEPSEELVHEFEELLRECWCEEVGFHDTAKEVAKRHLYKLMQPDVNAELIPMWQLKKVENALRLTNNIYGCANKITSFDRMVVEALEFCREAISNYEKQQ